MVPSLLELQEKGFGIDQGIPTLGIAAASLENVFSISLVGVFLGIAFSEGTCLHEKLKINFSHKTLRNCLVLFLPCNTSSI